MVANHCLQRQTKRSSPSAFSHISLALPNLLPLFPSLSLPPSRPSSLSPHLTRPVPQVHPFLGLLLHLAVEDSGSQDVHDRALLYYRLLSSDVHATEKIFEVRFYRLLLQFELLYTPPTTLHSPPPI